MEQAPRQLDEDEVRTQGQGVTGPPSPVRGIPQLLHWNTAPRPCGGATIGGMGWRWGARRLLAAAGTTSVVVGFVGLIVAAELLPLDAGRTSLAMVGLLALIPVGFVLMYEGLVTWLADGSPYPWRRRLRGATAGLAAFGVIVLTHGLGAQLLPHTWWAGLLVSGLLGWMGLAVFKRLRPSQRTVTDASADG